MSPSPELESGQSDMLNSAGILGTIITSKMLSDYENIPVIDSIATTPTVDRVSPPPSYVASTNTQHTNDKPTPALKPKSSPPQLIPDLPIATEKALKTFEVITANHYQYGTLGRSQEELESMTCDCSWTGGAFFHLIVLLPHTYFVHRTARFILPFISCLRRYLCFVTRSSSSYRV